jgi:hypothetical protein
MDREEIKKYILTHKENYSKESLVSKMKEAGHSEKEINSVYSEIDNVNISKVDNTSNKNTTTKKGKAGLGLFFIILGIFVPILGFAFIIGGIIFGFKTKKVSVNKSFSLFVIIFGFIALILAVFIQIFIYNVIMFSFVDFGSMLPAMVVFDNFNFQPIVSDTFVYDNLVVVPFSYVGASPIKIDSNSANLIQNDCILTEFINKVTSVESTIEKISFRSGHNGYFQFDCSVGNLKKGEMFEDTLEFSIIDLRTENSVLVSAEFRLPIN